MKKGLLFLNVFILVLFTTKVSAQDFDLDFYQYFNAHMADYGKTDAKSAFTAWRGNGSTNPVPKVTQNNISASVLQNNRVNSLSPGNEPDDTNPQYIRAQFGHNDCAMIIESTVPIKTLALVYRSSGTTATGFTISYGPSADDVDLAPATVTFDPVDNSMNAPGVAKFHNFTETDVKYIVIRRSTGTAPKLYRIAASSSSTFSTLPLNLLSFNAKADALGKSVNLNWKTTNEVNTKEFLIERRTDNSQFESIGIKASKNVAGEHSYSYTDYTAASGNVYYRLKQVDNDGKFTYSDVVSVNLSGSATVSAYPNPTTGLLNVEHGPVNGGSLSVFDLQGKVLISQSLANGASSTSVNVAKLVPGTYVLNVTNSGKQTTLKFIKN
ncbi:hypothetical protein BCY91_13595 [Pelobium manganitolerans]|uniref:Secretion system C-terminal sorting domain-containing protein n=1 Tax=Pelobium manganitolerans TaxID=1842495 RepID=A0A419SAY6_9SPHI|nr:T9SS type A sorting domain-containing protein [Pelobium manganitolerans]RKD19616.1 hypothetical protein BCY91_13595 [Pelobium manganitolerans]